MTAQQKQQFRETYNQLRLSLAFPGEAIAETRKAYTPVNKDEWTWDDVLADTTPPAYTVDRLFWLSISRHEQPIAKAA